MILTIISIAAHRQAVNRKSKGGYNVVINTDGNIVVLLFPPFYFIYFILFYFVSFLSCRTVQTSFNG